MNGDLSIPRTFLLGSLAGVAATLPFVVVDSLVARRVLDLGFWDLLALQRGSLGMSVLAYDLLFLALVGALLGGVLTLFGFACPRTSSCRRLHFKLCALAIGTLVIATRGWSHLTQTRVISHGSFILISSAFLILVMVLSLASRNWFVDWIYRVRTLIPLAIGWLVVVGILIVWPGLSRPLLPSPRIAAAGRSGLPNVLLIVLDTVRADAVSGVKRQGALTPNLDQIAASGARFTSALSTSAWTLPAHASLMTGLYPSQHGAGWQHRRLDRRFLTLAESFDRHGYETIGVSENPFVGRATGFSQGFHTFDQVWQLGRVQEPVGLAFLSALQALMNRSSWTGEYTVETVSRFTNWLSFERNRSRPFFAFLNFMAGHLPSYPRGSCSQAGYSTELLARIEPVNRVPERHYLPQYRLNSAELAVMRDLYLCDIQYLDSRLGGLFESLRIDGELDNTIVVVTADHGENFGDHDLIEHQLCLYNSLLHVPLILRYPPRVEAGLVVDEPVSTAFLPATLAELTGFDLLADRPDIEERTLFTSEDSSWLFFEYGNPVAMLRDAIGAEGVDFDFSRYDRRIQGVTNGSWKLIAYSNGTRELFDIANDWQENVDRADTEQHATRRLEEILIDWLSGVSGFEQTSDVPEFDEATREALEALGYIQ